MFELTEALIRGVLFAMENQDDIRVMDMQEGVLVDPARIPPGERPAHPDEIDPSGRYQPIPDWGSAQGFQLMEEFLAELHHPRVQDALQEILLSGHKVFRRVKDTIREHPAVEKRYHRFKYMAMRTVVVAKLP